VALFCLVWLYHGIHDTIAVHKPLAKFLSVKAVVFLSFWQSVLIAGLVHWGVIHNGSQFDTQQIQVGLQDLCIAIEMFIAAVAHYFIFPVAPYEDGRVFEMLKESRPTQHGIGVEMAVVVTDQPTSPAPSAAVGGAAPRREKMKSTTLEAIKAGETQEEVQTDEMQQEVAQVENATAECVTD
jgi:hypothetical protein